MHFQFSGASFVTPFSRHKNNPIKDAPFFLGLKGIFMKKEKKEDIVIKKNKVNQKHIDFYDKTLEVLGFILDEFSRELSRADIEYIEMPKNTIATLDFLISSIARVQKGQRLALGLDEKEFADTSPQINIIEGLLEEKI